MIDSYRFGEMVIDGRRFGSDLIIRPDGITPNWWRKEGHQICLDDIESALEGEVEVLVVGTGASGLVDILPEVHDFLAQRGIQLVAHPTREAVSQYNQLAAEKKVVGAFHLTC